jgi:hypothetical protein
MSKAPKPNPRNLAEALTSVVTKATGKWRATKKSEERHPSYVGYRRVRMTAARGLSQKDAAARVMEEAYKAASANGTLPATARQVMYAARPKIEASGSIRFPAHHLLVTLDSCASWLLVSPAANPTDARYVGISR